MTHDEGRCKSHGTWRRIGLGVVQCLAFAGMLSMPVAGCHSSKSSLSSRVCYSSGVCVNPDGTRVNADGTPYDPNITVTISQDQNAAPTTFPPLPPVAPNCHCTITADDLDGDCLANDIELGAGYDPDHVNDATNPNSLGDPNNPNSPYNPNNLGNPNFVYAPVAVSYATDPSNADTDNDLVRDGCEDRNHNGIFDIGEENPRIADTDGDHLFDGLEDANQNGIQDNGETSAVLVDSDHDGIADGTEDVNRNGLADAWVDANHDGCFNAGDTAGESDPRQMDTDKDGVPDPREDKNGNGAFDAAPLLLHETIAWFNDSDCDGLPDGKEDLNHDGVIDPAETDPRSADTDGDLLADGLEDINHNGVWDHPAETNPRLIDTDGDGIGDGVEDRNHNGHVDAWVDANTDTCFSSGDTQGETDPRLLDSDADGLADTLEDVNHDGLCAQVSASDPLHPGQSIMVFTETCGFLKDTDCDGISDGLEDRNHNGIVDVGETSPRLPDSDFDTLADGCRASTPGAFCEDKNNNGLVDAGETNPTLADTDGDSLPDGCEVNFGPHPPAGGTNPLSDDTDVDGYVDGDEDANHNCVKDGAETDPRVYDGPPLSGTVSFAKWNICAPENLENVTFAASSRPTHNFRMAFEVERTTTTACPNNTDAECSGGQTCLNHNCLLQASYALAPYGKDLDGGGYNADDQNDLLYGYTFQSPPGIIQDAVTSTVLNRDVYGFMQVSEDTRPLDDILDAIRQAFVSRYSGATVVELGNLPSRPAFDSIAKFPVNFAQRQLEVTFINPGSALGLRNDILVNQFLGGTTPDPATAVPSVDPVYGAINTCSLGTPHCYQKFRLDVGAVGRTRQLGPTGLPVVIIVVALTPDDSSASNPAAAANRFFSDRLTRLDDLTGGSAVAQFAAGTGHACDQRDQALAHADMLWVVDDSRSMQQIISRLQQAATAAQASLTSNAGIVDFRVSMTTTNPSGTAKAQCPSYCNAACGSSNPNDSTICTQTCADQTLGCIKACPTSCSGGGCNAANPPTCTCGTCGGTDTNGNPDDCEGSCTMPASLPAAIALAGNNNQLPGGGGTFYYENTYFLDCDSSQSSASQIAFLNQCSQPAYNRTGSNPNFVTFLGPAHAEKALFANAGFLGSDLNAQCPVAPMDLFYNTSLGSAYTACGDAAHPCCGRLVDACTDGPTVLSSQMCDLIRAMGGVPYTDPNNLGLTSSSARRHSSPEMGTRSARRLLQSMLPALPANWQPNWDSNNYTPATHLRLMCTAVGANDPNCQPCSDLTLPTCQTVPLATVFLSDEEDFWFKDDCMPDQQSADKQQLPSACLYVDGNPNTVDTCTAAYCSQFDYGNPAGYDPDQAAWAEAATASPPQGFYTLEWRNSQAPECADTDPATTCVGDPCPALLNSGDCSTFPECVWGANYTDGGQILTISSCVNRCTVHVYPLHVGTPQDANLQKSACLADAACRWDASQVSSGNQGPVGAQAGACVMKQPINDCQPCKRYMRLMDAIAPDPNYQVLNHGPSALTGFGQTGPVYAIIRNKGQPGAGGPFTSSLQDSCNGGYVTWGRGDGQSYRDLAINTLGRTQDVCAADYTSFMSLVVSDLAVLSTPYPLSQAPIASTIKVGLARAINGDANNATFIPVARSQTTGFIYDASNNSIGFISDPVDGACVANAGCTANGVIEESEIIYARTLPTVPEPNDVVFISYRFWEPVPCGVCPAGETCARVVCQDYGTSASCQLNDSSTCPPGYTCSGTTCSLGCTPGTLVDACVNVPDCGTCETFDPNTQKCEALADQCACNTSGGHTCNPRATSVNQCPVGWACDETCVCSQISSCATNTFHANGSVSSCSAALACCATFATDANSCVGLSEADCTSMTHSANCTWDTTSHTCGYSYATCCASSSEVECFADPETGVSTIYCAPQPCVCPVCATGLDCDPTTPDTTNPGSCICFQNTG